MSFSITESGKSKDLVKSIRDGDHHKKGEHTQLDQAREYIAEELNRLGGAQDWIALTVSDHHSETGRSLSISMDIRPEP